MLPLSKFQVGKYLSIMKIILLVTPTLLYCDKIEFRILDDMGRATTILMSQSQYV